MAFERGGRRSNMKFLDADVRRLLVSVSAIVDDENVVVFGPQEAYIENTSTSADGRARESKEGREQEA